MDGLINMMEETVITKIDKIWPSTKYCKCDKCKINIAAHALNKLPPKYVHTLEGQLIHKFDTSTTQMDAEITACVYNAIVKVGEGPEHGVEVV